ncbi:FUSC family protein [Leucobacter chinensis]|uniref:FUSC family protein n=1 Tax=Leucobacter chinensis TaxID=2851010 RepID=UPI001C24F905|nr:FUSC family protein [Leucobacter chinensis]
MAKPYLDASEPRFSLRIGSTSARYALVLVGSAAAVLGACYAFIGPHTAQAGYLSIMVLLSAARAPSKRYRYIAAAWAVFVAMLGYLVGPLGLWATLIALMAVSLVQGLFKFGEVAFLTRSPVNLIAFAAISHGEVRPWQVLFGSVIGAGFILLMTSMLPARTEGNDRQVPVADRLRYGVMVALGAVSIVLLAEALSFAHADWALLTFCVILAVGGDRRAERATDRVIGSLTGVVLATLATLAPVPVQLAVALASLLLCVAYLREANYTMFVTFLTPAILLTTASEGSAVSLGVQRIEAVVAAAVIAVFCSWLFERRVPSGSEVGDL